ncbi:MAG: hypothetical protein GY850_18360 [bacterium]|nr:hypothetical protein [bacterium]
MNPEPLNPYRWLMLALLGLLYTCFGIVARSIFPLATPILADLELSYSQMGLILGSWQMTYIVAALVAGTILDRWGVRKSIVVYGVFTFTIALHWLLLASGEKPGEQSEGSRSQIFDVFVNLIKISNVRILLIMGLLAFAIGHGFSSWLPKILEDSGMSASQAGWAAAGSIAAGIPSILALPSLVPPRFRGRIIAVLAVMTTVNLVLVMKISGIALYLGLATLGFISAPFMAEALFLAGLCIAMAVLTFFLDFRS